MLAPQSCSVQEFPTVIKGLTWKSWVFWIGGCVRELVTHGGSSVLMTQAHMIDQNLCERDFLVTIL